jgi:hypothetical protein
MVSSYQNGDIKIDGDISDWGKNIQKIPDNNFSLGFKNDDKFLYIALMTEDRSKIFQMFRAGFIVWLEPESGDYKTFGIKYPLPGDQGDMPQMPEANAEGMNRDGADREGENRGGMDRERMPRENMFDKMLITQNEFEVVNKDKYPLIALPIANKEGIETKLAFQGERLVYELKIPLADNKQYSFVAGALPGDKIKIGFETEQVEKPKSGEDRSGMKMSGEGGEEPGEGDMAGGGGRGGGRRGGGMRPGGKFGARTAPLNYTVELSLVKQPVK